jgi:hypothetical protein
MKCHLFVRAALILIEIRCILLPVSRLFAQRSESLPFLTPSVARSRQANAPNILCHVVIIANTS